MNKMWYESLTLWVNAIGIVAVALQCKFGFVVSPEYQAMALTVINAIVRAVTKKPIVFSARKVVT